MNLFNICVFILKKFSSTKIVSTKMSKFLQVVMYCWTIFFINRIESIKLTPENVLSLLKTDFLGDVNNLKGQNISDIDPVALEVINSTRLNLYNNKLQYLQEDLFNYNSRFQKLYFNFNKISGFHPRVFQKLPNLIHIYLSNNELTEIDGNLFDENTKLIWLYIDNNRLRFFYPNTFRSLKNLEILDVSFNQLKAFDMHLLSSTKKLEWLMLGNNNLTELRYNDLKLSLPKLNRISVIQNKFNCSFAQQFEDHVRDNDIDTYSNPVSCVSDEEFAAIVKDRYLDNLVINQQ